MKKAPKKITKKALAKEGLRKPKGPKAKQRLRAALTVRDMRDKGLVAGGQGLAREMVDPNRLEIELLLDQHGAQGKAVAVLMDCLSAVRTYYNIFAKKMVTEPDYATRQAAARTLLEYGVGKPVVRQQILIGKVESMAELMEKMRQSPALCATIEDMLKAAKTLEAVTAQ